MIPELEHGARLCLAWGTLGGVMGAVLVLQVRDWRQRRRYKRVMAKMEKRIAALDVLTREGGTGWGKIEGKDP